MEIKFKHVPDFDDIAGLYIDGKLSYHTIEGINSLTDQNEGNEQNLIELEYARAELFNQKSTLERQKQNAKEPRK